MVLLFKIEGKTTPYVPEIGRIGLSRGFEIPMEKVAMPMI